MSLETSLELNNKLLTQQNELQTRNIALLERLVSTLAPDQVIRRVSQAPEYREAAPDKQTSETADEGKKTAPGMDSLDFEDVVALAGLYPVPEQHTTEMYQRAVDYRNATGADRVEKIDALHMALQGVEGVEELSKFAILDLARRVLRLWDDLPTIKDRRDFASRHIGERSGSWDDIKPAREESERKGPFYWKDDAGGFGLAETAGEWAILAGESAGRVRLTEINRVEYLQLKDAEKKTSVKSETNEPDFTALRKQAEDLILQLAKGGYRAEAIAILNKFNAQKLGQVADSDLEKVIAHAETALEG